MHVGVDIGGTFTDFVFHENGTLRIHKRSSTPQNPALAMLEGLRTLAGETLQTLQQVSHGSTVATNAILERKGAKIALITTQGFRDVLFIGRQNRSQLYALNPQLPAPLVPRERCYDVPERLDFRGEVLQPLDIKALDKILDDIAKQKVEAVAVCLLFSYMNPAHEQAIRDRIRERGLLEDWQVALSSDVLPEFREYERASTVALEAYVRPIMGRYVQQIADALPSSCHLRIMKSDGGVISASTVRQQAVQTALSGPAAGVIAAHYLARLAGYDNVVTLDMGGTSTDVALFAGRPTHRPESQIDNLPLRFRLLDIETIGAGGGSIARLDAGGALRVGPESAGADPGPIVYGRGGEQLTVSDANAILGRLDPEHFLGGEMPLQLDAAQKQMEQLAEQMGVTAVQAAAGIIEVANININRALRRVSVSRGHDPRHFTLVAFGGAGPLHACDVARSLRMPRVLIPRYPGVLCAFGLLVADIALEYSRPVMRPVTIASVAEMRVMMADMMRHAHDDLKREGVPKEQRRFRAILEMRYKGQAYELPVSLSFGKIKAQVVEAFHETHERTYGHALRDREVEAVNLRLQAIGIIEKPSIEPAPMQDNSGADALLRLSTAPNGQRLALYDRELLVPGARFPGPALIFQLDCTTYIPEGWKAYVDGYRNLILEDIAQA